MSRMEPANIVILCLPDGKEFTVTDIRRIIL